MNECTLINIFYEYIKISQEKISILVEPAAISVIHLAITKKLLLLKAVEELESLKLFNELVEKTKELYSADPSLSHLDWRSPVRHFFRRSGAYLDFFDKKDIDYDCLYKVYNDAFIKREATKRYLVPLGGVSFDSCEYIDFDTFSIKRYSANKLDEIVANKINEVFYPYAILEVKILSKCWFIEVTDKEYILTIEEIFEKELDDLLLEFNIHRSFLEYPEIIKSVLYKLILYGWKEDNFRKYKDSMSWPWNGYYIPFIGEINNNLVSAPGRAPDPSKLLTTNYFDSEKTEENLGKGPIFTFYLDRKETIELIKIILKTSEVLNQNVLEKWPFINIALEYLTKAFFTNSDKNALEQLLWHITAIECLLGEKNSGEKNGITKRLRNRLTRIPGISISKKQFDNLYKIRSDLVHGNPFKRESAIYLFHARDSARLACLWFLNICSDINNKSGNELILNVHSRKDILALLDSDEVLSR
jgi:hypothetical protein